MFREARVQVDCHDFRPRNGTAATVGDGTEKCPFSAALGGQQPTDETQQHRCETNSAHFGAPLGQSSSRCGRESMEVRRQIPTYWKLANQPHFRRRNMSDRIQLVGNRTVELACSKNSYGAGFGTGARDSGVGGKIAKWSHE